jgi:hypothetical protein
MGKLPKERISGGQRSSASWGAPLSDLLRTKTRVNDCTLCPIDPEMDSVPLISRVPSGVPFNLAAVFVAVEDPCHSLLGCPSAVVR